MDKTDITVLGGGLVGGFIARTLASEPRFAVTLCDHDKAALKRCALGTAMETRQLDLSRAHNVHTAVAGADFVVGALPGFLGFQALRAVIESGKNSVDISFFPEDAGELRALAAQKGVTAVIDCGVMPGLGGMLGVHLAAALAKPERLTIMVGGLPVERRWPLEYKAPFSPIDVLEEYTRPARLVEHGSLVTRPALSEVELVDLPGVGTLEAFNTDGLRTLLETLPLPWMREKTLRYPGHSEIMRVLRELGFFSEKPVQVSGHEVRPLDLSARLLTEHWRLKPGEQELTVMRVEVEGVNAHGSRELRRADLLDRTDPATGAFSMARTTGYPAVIALRMLADPASAGLAGRGILPAELLGQDEALCDIMLDSLAEAGIAPKFEVIEL